MPGRRKMAPPLSPAEIALYTGMDAPGLAAGVGRRAGATLPDRTDDLVSQVEVVPGQSGGEGIDELPNAGPDDPHDGP